jgi:hypothetical protein
MNDRDRARADRLRAVPLEEVLHRLGGEPDRHDPRRWRTTAGIVSICGPKFMNWTGGIGGGGAIDLAIHLRSVTFRDALDWLDREFGPGPEEPAATAMPPPALRLPPPGSEKLAGVKAYLVSQRAIPAATVESLAHSGALYADARANAVFVLHGSDGKPVGAELRGTGRYAWRGMAPGSNKDLGFFAIGAEPASAVVLCESAIDAISCSLLHPLFRCVSTAGARPHPLWLDALVARLPEVYCGFDADTTGEHMAREMIARHPNVRRLRPSLKDWNDVLRARS